MDRRKALGTLVGLPLVLLGVSTVMPSKSRYPFRITVPSILRRFPDGLTATQEHEIALLHAGDRVVEYEEVWEKLSEDCPKCVPNWRGDDRGLRSAPDTSCVCKDKSHWLRRIEQRPTGRVFAFAKVVPEDEIKIGQDLALRARYGYVALCPADFEWLAFNEV